MWRGADTRFGYGTRRRRIIEKFKSFYFAESRKLTISFARQKSTFHNRTVVLQSVKIFIKRNQSEIKIPQQIIHSLLSYIQLGI